MATEMKRTMLVRWLLGIGILLWLSSVLAESQPLFATVMVLTTLVFSAVVAARPSTSG